MTDLFKKLNVLVKAKVSDVLADITSGEILPRFSNKKLDQDVEMLRERINDAIAHEDKLQAQVRQFQEEIALLDGQADDAVKQGNEAAARHLITQIKRAQQRLEMVESDLQAHQIVAQDLIYKVNMLEATVGDLRYDEAQQSQQQASEQPTESGPAGALSSVINDARDRMSQLGEQIRKPTVSTDSLEDSNDADDQNSLSVDNDLQTRRDRLSKR